jgi:hypothetical protein
MAAARKVSAAHNSTVLPSERKHLGQFADGRGLAATVHAHHQNYLGSSVHARHWLRIGGVQDG